METTAGPALRAERWVILTVLLTLAGVGWALVAWQASGMNGSGGRLDLTMGMTAPLFIAMCMAMMFPASVPMILAFARTQTRKRADGGEYVPTWLSWPRTSSCGPLSARSDISSRRRSMPWPATRCG